MQEDLKRQLHTLVDSIEDKAKLQLLIQDAEAYLTGVEEEDDLSDEDAEGID
jgi:hypothetical protein